MAVLNNRRVLLAGTALWLLAGCDKLPGMGDKASFKAVDITGAEYARELSMPDANGRERSLADFKGKVTLVFFGYTQCPDVCPTTLAELASVKKALGAQGERVERNGRHGLFARRGRRHRPRIYPRQPARRRQSDHSLELRHWCTPNHAKVKETFA